MLNNYHLIPESHFNVHEALLNWVKWLSTSPPQRRTPSLEGNYRPPPMYEPPSPRLVLDHKQAQAIEELVVSAPHKYGKHITMWYIKRLNPIAVKRKLSITNLDSHIYDAREYIRTRLTL